MNIYPHKYINGPESLCDGVPVVCGRLEGIRVALWRHRWRQTTWRSDTGCPHWPALFLRLASYLHTCLPVDKVDWFNRSHSARVFLWVSDFGSVSSWLVIIRFIVSAHNVGQWLVCLVWISILPVAIVSFTTAPMKHTKKLEICCHNLTVYCNLFRVELACLSSLYRSISPSLSLSLFHSASVRIDANNLSKSIGDWRYRCLHRSFWLTRLKYTGLKYTGQSI